MKTKDILIGIVLGMMIMGVVSQSVTTVKYLVDVEKEKVDYLSSSQSKTPNTYLRDEVKTMVDTKYKLEKREEAYRKIGLILMRNGDIDKAITCLDDNIPSTTTTTTLEPTTTTIGTIMPPTTTTTHPTTTSTLQDACEWNKASLTCTGVCGEKEDCVELDVGYCGCKAI